MADVAIRKLRSTSLNFHDTIPPKIRTLFGGQLQAHIEAWNRIQIGLKRSQSAGLPEGNDPSLKELVFIKMSVTIFRR